MNGPQCAGSVLTSPHQCAWDTLIKKWDTPWSACALRGAKPPPIEEQERADLNNSQICLSFWGQHELRITAKSRYF